MAMRLHTFVTSQKRYIQVESQPHHIIGIFHIIIHSKNISLADIHGACYQDEEDGTITFYQAQKTENSHPGIWTYLVYECPPEEEKVFSDPSIPTNINPIISLLAGEKLPLLTCNIHEYLKYKSQASEYLEIQLPDNWNHTVGKAIANILVAEWLSLQSLPIFTEGAGKVYMQAVLEGFIQAAQQILDTRGTVEAFEAAQYDVIQQVQIDDLVNLIVDYNDYRLWQAALPSRSKAVEYAFNTALSLICRI